MLLSQEVHSMEIVRLTPQVAPEWDRFVHHSDNGWAFHLAGWLEQMAAIWNRHGHNFAYP